MDIASFIRHVPDYPKPGILFYDITPLLASPEAFGDVIERMADAARPLRPTRIVAMTENDLEYAPEDSEFLWTSLYYMLSLYGQMDERAEFTDDTLILPSEMVRDYAAALYPQVEQLPGIPSPISQRIRYQASDDSYHLARGDEGLAEVVLQTPITLASGAVILTGQLNALEDGSVLRDFQVTLSPRDSMFGYVITDLT